MTKTQWLQQINLDKLALINYSIEELKTYIETLEEYKRPLIEFNPYWKN